jgi:hypothetical protein
VVACPGPAGRRSTCSIIAAGKGNTERGEPKLLLLSLALPLVLRLQLPVMLLQTLAARYARSRRSYGVAFNPVGLIRCRSSKLPACVLWVVVWPSMATYACTAGHPAVWTPHHHCCAVLASSPLSDGSQHRCGTTAQQAPASHSMSAMSDT